MEVCQQLELKFYYPRRLFIQSGFVFTLHTWYDSQSYYFNEDSTRKRNSHSHIPPYKTGCAPHDFPETALVIQGHIVNKKTHELTILGASVRPLNLLPFIFN